MKKGSTLQKKQSTLQQHQGKMQENSHYRFFYFELPLQRFFNLKYPIFNFFLNIIFSKNGGQIEGPSKAPRSKLLGSSDPKLSLEGLYIKKSLRRCTKK